MTYFGQCGPEIKSESVEQYTLFLISVFPPWLHPKASFSLRSKGPTAVTQAPNSLQEACPFGKGGSYCAKNARFSPLSYDHNQYFLWAQSCKTATVPVAKASREPQLSSKRTRPGSAWKLESVGEILWRREQEKVILNHVYKPTKVPSSLPHAAHVQNILK